MTFSKKIIVLFVFIIQSINFFTCFSAEQVEKTYDLNQVYAMMLNNDVHGWYGAYCFWLNAFEGVKNLANKEKTEDIVRGLEVLNFLIQIGFEPASEEGIDLIGNLTKISFKGDVVVAHRTLNLANQVKIQQSDQKKLQVLFSLVKATAIFSDVEVQQERLALLRLLVFCKVSGSQELAIQLIKSLLDDKNIEIMTLRSQLLAELWACKNIEAQHLAIDIIQRHIKSLKGDAVYEQLRLLFDLVNNNIEAVKPLALAKVKALECDASQIEILCAKIAILRELVQHDYTDAHEESLALLKDVFNGMYSPEVLKAGYLLLLILIYKENSLAISFAKGIAEKYINGNDRDLAQGFHALLEDLNNKRCLGCSHCLQEVNN